MNASIIGKEAVVSIVLLLLFIFTMNILRRYRMSPSSLIRESFLIKDVVKDMSHPFYLQGSSQGYSIYGKQGKTLHLKRGLIYQFDIRSSLPFYLSDSPEGSDTGNSPGTLLPEVEPLSNIRLTVMISDRFPDRFYYVSSEALYAGGTIIVENL